MHSKYRSLDKLKNSTYYKEALHELNYSFGDYYLFENFVVSEINEDVQYTWKNHGKKVVEEIFALYDNNGESLIYITNRINNYAVMPTGWITFFKDNYQLKGYGIVCYTQKGYENALLEKTFLKTKVKPFRSLNEAIEWAKNA